MRHFFILESLVTPKKLLDDSPVKPSNIKGFRDLTGLTMPSADDGT